MIYLIYNKELDHVKIGYSNNPKKRLKTLQTGNSNRLSLLKSFEGTLEQEKTIHKLLKEHRRSGEWYDYSVIRNVLNNILEKNLYKKEVIRPRQDSFYMTFIDFMSPYFDLKTVREKNLLHKLCSLAEYNTGKISVTTGLRKEICEDLGLSTQHFSNTIKLLKDKNLISGDKGEFYINPEIFWKGETKMRDKLLKDEKIKITFNFYKND